MSVSRDISGFGKRLHDLRESRYKELPSQYAYCKNQQTFCEAIENEEPDSDRSIRRQTLASWENGKSYPSISRLLILCKLLDCNPNYLLKGDKPINQEVQIVSEITELELKSIEVLKGNKLLVDFLNYLLTKADRKFIELINFIRQEATYRYLDNDLLMNYKPVLKKKMEKAFSRSLDRTSVYDEPLIEYKHELEKEIRALYESHGDSGILEYIDEDVHNQIRNAKSEKHILDNSEDSYNLIVDFLVDFSYQPLSHMNESEQNLGRILQMFADLVHGYFNDKLPKMKKCAMAYAAAKRKNKTE